MKRFLRSLLKITLFTIIALLGLSVLLSAIFEKQIGERIIRLLNQQLTTELTVGDINLSALRTFPSLSANLNQVRLAGTDGDALLETGTLSFRFGLLSFLSSKYQIKSVKMTNGILRISNNRQAEPNYLVYQQKGANSPTSKSNISINLEEAILQDIDVIYDDQEQKQYAHLAIQQARFSGAFDRKDFSLDSDARILSKAVNIDNTRYLVNKSIRYQANLNVDLEEGIYALQRVDTEVEGNAFSLSGVIETWDEGLFYDLLVTNEKGSISGVLQALPESLSQSLGGFESKGAFRFQATVKGPATPSQSPEIIADLTLKDGELIHPTMGEAFNDVSFKAKFTNGPKKNNQTSMFTIDDFTGYFKRQRTEMNLTIQNLDDPQINFYIDGAVPMGAVYNMLGSPSITNGSGEIEIQKLRIEGKYADMKQTNRIGRVNTQGRLEFDDASLTINGEKITFDRGTIDIDGNQLLVQEVRLEGAGSDLQLQGTAFNLLPVAFADSTNNQNASLEFQAQLDADKMDISKLLSTFSLKINETDTLNITTGEVDSIKTATVQKQQKLTQILKGTFQTNIKSYSYQDISGKDFSGQLDFSTNQIGIKGATQTMQGEIELDGRLFFFRQPALEATLVGNELDIKTFFAQTHNLGQQVLTQDHISGTLKTNALIYAFWDNQGNFQSDQLRILAAIAIEDGRLKNFELMERFSNFVNIKDLRNIKFSRLENYLEIADNRLYLPAMFLQSNAMNMTFSGEHDFSNNFEYNIQVNAGQVAANRFKSHDPTLRPIKAKQKGFFNLYYRIFGNLEAYEVASSKRQVAADFSRSQYRKIEVQRALFNAFGPIEIVQEPKYWSDEGAQESTEFLDFDIESKDKQQNRNQ